MISNQPDVSTYDHGRYITVTNIKLNPKHLCVYTLSWYFSPDKADCTQSSKHSSNGRSPCCLLQKVMRKTGSTCIWEHLRTLHRNTSSHCGSPRKSALWTFDHQAQNCDCGIPLARLLRTLPTWLSTVPPRLHSHLNHITPLLRAITPSPNDSSVLSKHLTKPDSSNSFY